MLRGHTGDAGRVHCQPIARHWLLSRAGQLLGARAVLMARARTVVQRWIGEQDGQVHWLRPEAGAFCCARLNPDIFSLPDVRRFYDRLGDRRTAVAPGLWFGDSAHVMRLGLAYPPADALEKGLVAISDALRPEPPTSWAP